MKIVGIDPSMTGTGLADADGTLSTIRTTSTDYEITARHARLTSIADQALSVAHGADIIVIEAPSLGQRAQAGVVDRYGLWWMIVSRALNAGIRVIDVPPSTVKKFASGKGNATKSDMRMALFQRADIDCRDDNQVDAWWLRAIGHELEGTPIVNLPAAQITAIQSLRTS